MPKDRQRRKDRPSPMGFTSARAASSVRGHGGRDGKTQAGRAAQGFTFNKGLGQHILKNPLVVKTIIEKAGIQPTDVVLEIGPGTGNLTMKLLEVARKVVAVEFDPRMVAELAKRAKESQHGHKLQIIHGDFLKVQLPFFNLCVANCPYQISSPLVFKLLAHRPQFRGAYLMFQREFVDRMVAKPGTQDYTRLSLNCQLLSKCSHMMKVSKNCFRPPPKVESSVVKMEPLKPAPKVDFLEWDGLLRICFQRPNKTLRAVFNNKHVLGMLEKNYRTVHALQGDMDYDMAPANLDDTKVKVLGVLESTDLHTERANKLTQTDFLVLLNAFNQNGFHFKS